jgi:hypothetical protein
MGAAVGLCCGDGEYEPDQAVRVLNPLGRLVMERLPATAEPPSRADASAYRGELARAWQDTAVTHGETAADGFMELMALFEVERQLEETVDPGDRRRLALLLQVSRVVWFADVKRVAAQRALLDLQQVASTDHKRVAAHRALLDPRRVKWADQQNGPDEPAPAADHHGPDEPAPAARS